MPPASVQLGEGLLPQNRQVRECSLKATFCLLLRRVLSGPPPGTSLPGSSSATFRMGQTGEPRLSDAV